MASLGQDRPEKFLNKTPAEQRGGLLNMDSGELSRNRLEGLDRANGKTVENVIDPNNIETSSQFVNKNNPAEITHELSADTDKQLILNEETVLEHLHGGAKVNDPAALLEQVLNLADKSKTDSAYKL